MHVNAERFLAELHTLRSFGASGVGKGVGGYITIDINLLDETIFEIFFAFFGIVRVVQMARHPLDAKLPWRDVLGEIENDIP